MKTIIVFFLFIFSFNVFSQSSLRVIYSFLSNHETNKNEVNDINFTLLTNKQESIYQQNDKMINEGNLDRKILLALAGKGIFYTSLIDSVKFKQTDLLGHEFLIKSPLDVYKWTLTNETKKIGKYLCYKATTVWEEYNPMKKRTVKDKIVAWYTSEIPIPFGPAGYDGLPGLVLEINNKKGILLVTSIEFVNKNKIRKPVSGEPVNIENYPDLLYKIAKKEFGFK